MSLSDEENDDKSLSNEGLIGEQDESNGFMHVVYALNVAIQRLENHRDNLSDKQLVITAVFDLLLEYYTTMQMFWLFADQIFHNPDSINRATALQRLKGIILQQYSDLIDYFEQEEIQSDPTISLTTITFFAEISEWHLRNFQTIVIQSAQLALKYFCLGKGGLGKGSSGQGCSETFELHDRNTSPSQPRSLEQELQYQYIQDVFVELFYEKDLCLTIGSTYAENVLLKSDTVMLASAIVDPEDFSMIYVGFACLNYLREYHPDLSYKTMYIELICTLQGYGSKLISYIIEYAKSLRLQFIKLSAITTAINFYRRIGFKLTEDKECGERSDIERLAEKVKKLRFETAEEYKENAEFAELLNTLVKHKIVKNKNCVDIDDCSTSGYSMTYCLK